MVYHNIILLLLLSPKHAELLSVEPELHQIVIANMYMDVVHQSQFPLHASWS